MEARIMSMGFGGVGRWVWEREDLQESWNLVALHAWRISGGIGSSSSSRWRQREAEEEEEMKERKRKKERREAMDGVEKGRDFFYFNGGMEEWPFCVYGLCMEGVVLPGGYFGEGLNG